MNAILRPPDRLAEVVGSGCKAVIAARKWGKSPHLVVLPNEPQIDIADVVRRTVESRATPGLPQWLRIGSLGNTHDDSRGIFHVPGDTAVWSAKCAEVGEQTVSPQRSVPVPIWQSGIACHPALVIDAISAATRAAEIGKGRYLIVQSRLCCFRPLGMHGRQSRSAADSDQNSDKNSAGVFGCELC